MTKKIFIGLFVALCGTSSVFSESEYMTERALTPVDTKSTSFVRTDCNKPAQSQTFELEFSTTDQDKATQLNWASNGPGNWRGTYYVQVTTPALQGGLHDGKGLGYYSDYKEQRIFADKRLQRDYHYNWIGQKVVDREWFLIGYTYRACVKSFDLYFCSCYHSS